MNVTAWQSRRPQDGVDRFLNSFFGLVPRDHDDAAALGDGWLPSADIASDDEGYTFRFDLPGVSKDDIEVNLAEGVLSVSGSRRDVFEDDDGKVCRREVTTGRFTRSFRLPTDIDDSAVSANCSDGVLEVKVPRDKVKSSRSIPIE
ncbi:MAG: Hsp20/alpha crystallin family protein [Candidatus Binatia bacterium]